MVVPLLYIGKTQLPSKMRVEPSFCGFERLLYFAEQTEEGEQQRELKMKLKDTLKIYISNGLFNRVKE